MGTEEEVNEKRIKYGGWITSLLLILAGAYFIWPHIHTSLLGIILIYLGVRVFNISTFDEYKEKRINILHKLSNW